MYEIFVLCENGTKLSFMNETWPFSPQFWEVLQFPQALSEPDSVSTNQRGIDSIQPIREGWIRSNQSERDGLVPANQRRIDWVSNNQTKRGKFTFKLDNKKRDKHITTVKDPFHLFSVDPDPIQAFKSWKTQLWPTWILEIWSDPVSNKLLFENDFFEGRIRFQLFLRSGPAPIFFSRFGYESNFFSSAWS